MWATIKAAMSGRKLQIALLAGVLMLANAQCLLACAADPCDADRVPPCHKHQSKSSHAPPSCAHAPVLAEYRAPADVGIRLSPDVAIVDFVPLRASVLTETVVAQEATSPPVLPGRSLSTALRI